MESIIVHTILIQYFIFGLKVNIYRSIFKDYNRYKQYIFSIKSSR